MTELKEEVSVGNNENSLAGGKLYGFVLFMVMLLLLIPFLAPPAPVCCTALFFAAWGVLIFIDIWGIIDGFLPRLETLKELGYVVVLPILIIVTLGAFLIPGELLALSFGIGVIVLLKTLIALFAAYRFQQQK
ncbi:MAG: hypothetical protein ACFFD3_16055 [Candidatus Thorarchaeota archaeon]